MFSGTHGDKRRVWLFQRSEKIVLQHCALHDLLEVCTFTFIYVCPPDVLHGTWAHLNMPKWTVLWIRRDSRSLAVPEEKVLMQLLFGLFIPMLQSDVTVLTSATYLLFLLPPFTSASPSMSQSFSCVETKIQLFSFHLMSAALCSPWLTVSLPTIYVAVPLLTPPSLCTPQQALSALFLLVSTISSNSAASAS